MPRKRDGDEREGKGRRRRDFFRSVLVLLRRVSLLLMSLLLVRLSIAVVVVLHEEERRARQTFETESRKRESETHVLVTSLLVALRIPTLVVILRVPFSAVLLVLVTLLATLLSSSCQPRSRPIVVTPRSIASNVVAHHTRRVPLVVKLARSSSA